MALWQSHAFRWVVVFALVNLAVILAFQPFVISGDSIGYFETGRLLFGADGGVLHAERILKPAGPAVAFALGWITGTGVEAGLLIENALFYILTVFLIFALLMRMTRSEEAARWGSILYLSAYPLLRHGITYMTDISGWFFTLLAVYFAVGFFDEHDGRNAIYVGIAAGVGMLFKEYVVAGIIFFGLVLLFWRGSSWGTRIRYGVLFSIPILVIAGGWQIYSYRVYEATYFTWIATGGTGQYMWRDIPFMIKSLAATFLAGWVAVLGGVRMLMKDGARYARERTLALLLVVPSFSFLFWHVASSRIYFVGGILLVLVSSLYLEALSKRSPRARTLLLAFIVSVQYGWYIVGDGVRDTLWPWIQ